MSRTVRLDPVKVPAVVDVLHESFYDYPVMRFVLGSDEPRYSERLRTLVQFFVMARVFRDEALLGIRGEGELVAAALVSRPTGPGPRPELFQLREETWSELGEGARDRYAAFGQACAPLQVDPPHLHLNMIGVRRKAQGTGLGRLLLESVHELSRADSESVGVTLTTEDPANVSLYRRFGYEVVGEAVVAPELTTWGFFRQDDT